MCKIIKIKASIIENPSVILFIILKIYKMASKVAVRFGRQLKELRIHLCQTSQTSQGVR